MKKTLLFFGMVLLFLVFVTCSKKDIPVTPVIPIPITQPSLSLNPDRTPVWWNGSVNVSIDSDGQSVYTDQGPITGVVLKVKNITKDTAIAITAKNGSGNEAKSTTKVVNLSSYSQDISTTFGTNKGYTIETWSRKIGTSDPWSPFTNDTSVVDYYKDDYTAEIIGPNGKGSLAYSLKDDGSQITYGGKSVWNIDSIDTLKGKLYLSQTSGLYDYKRVYTLKK